MSEVRFTGQAAILLVRDVEKSLAYWNDKVGFTTGSTYGEPDQPIEFAIIQRDGRYLMLSRAPADHEIVPHWRIKSMLWNAYFWVDDSAALYEELKDRGAVIDYELCDQPYGVREFGIQDLDDHDIAFGQVIDGARAERN